MTAAPLRAARPISTTRRAAAMSNETPASMAASSATGQAHRCTLSGAAASTERTRFWYSSSATNGVNGASSLVTVTSASCSVW